MKLAGRTALVTGGSRGIGRATARLLAQQGADVVITYRENAAAAEESLRELKDLGATARAMRCDAASPEQVRAARVEIERDLGPVDILINNAGAISRPADWSQQSDEDLHRTIQVNLLSVIHGIRVFAPSMVDRGWGRIVNLTSTYSFNGGAAVLAYTAAKAGVNAVTTAMAAELGSQGVLVNAVAPGNIDTDMTRAAGQEVVDWAVRTTPVGRLGTVDEVATVIVHLVHTDFACGHTYVLDGGQILRI
ncbi:SDR family NAD(P)-dependent oxidoreductase [Nonomuraea sp. MCN248]|uniref:SDR family NAD(P)-dependent oxidoreductase n=1 Tax=Nonomuraea corallina TaxID=2989783 RepID=A0ABT4S7W6_9ACTN|nr:SDR family NAD(P)-dependent oxidoreductase [Nonomuraea corallina]MDA0633313.1 SDR family NAD(P)-dependent oxidoreductase [Nonomuraea corallina]